MAPTKVKAGAARGNNKRSSKPASSASTSKSKKQSSVHQAASKSKPAKKQATGPQQKRKRKEYSEKELNIPKLNMITPAGVQKPRGKKKGKVFVDDQESMMTILAMVNADKEGQIESKMMRARQMEEIRQARQREMDARAEQKKAKLDETKNSLRHSKKKLSTSEAASTPQDAPSAKSKPKKKVSFG